MKTELQIGERASGATFTLPIELAVRTLAIVGLRGSGKTVAATVIAEEMCEAGLPWVAIDPVGVWYGIRCNLDGSAGGYPVVVIGGQHADLPLEKDAGSRMADAILENNVSCVIDMSCESKNTVRHFVAQFCDRLMDLNPQVQRHIFLEEAPELVPQRPMGEQKVSRAAVDRLIRLGRNKGYGATLISQRFATIDKDVLTQCENLLALRCIGKHDRDAARDWIAEVVHDTSEKRAEQFMLSLAHLESGQGWFWSPQWLNQFLEIRIRQRKTYHPGATRAVGQAPKQVQLSDVSEFVERFRRALVQKTSKKVSVSHSRGAGENFTRYPSAVTDQDFSRLATLEQENSRLLAENSRLRQEVSTAQRIIDELRKIMEPEYRAMQRLFGELETAAASGIGAVEGSVFDPWKEKLAGSPAKLIDVLLTRGECTKAQLQTLSALGRETLRVALSKLNVNGLIEKDNDKIRLRIP